MASRAEFVAYQTGHAAGVVAPVEGGGHRLGQVAGQRLGQLPEELDEFLVGERRKGGGDGDLVALIVEAAGIVVLVSPSHRRAESTSGRPDRPFVTTQRNSSIASARRSSWVRTQARA